MSAVKVKRVFCAVCQKAVYPMDMLKAGMIFFAPSRRQFLILSQFDDLAVLSRKTRFKIVFTRFYSTVLYLRSTINRLYYFFDAKLFFESVGSFCSPRFFVTTNSIFFVLDCRNC
jgi:hypothetical protein